MARTKASLSWAGWLLLLACILLITTSGYFWHDDLVWFITGPGNYSRIIATLIVLSNLKSLPFAWSVRVLGAYIGHLYLFPPPDHTPEKLFHPVINQSHVPLFEIDYNMHKSNATFFTDLDVSRAHMMHLFAPAMHGLWDNSRTKLVMDPSKPTQPAKGSVKIIVGAVQTSFKKELKAYGKYEIWTRVLSWDRKWLYFVSHFVQKGTVKPRSWDNGNGWPSRSTPSKPEDWEKRILAVSITKLVFKVGRLTVHPAIVLGASGLLPPRPAGWTGDAQREEGTKEGLSEEVWDWKRVEKERLKGLEHAQHFAALDGLSETFNGGEDGAIGRFWLA